MREARICLYTEQWDGARAALAAVSGPWPALRRSIDLAWVETLPADMVRQATIANLHHATARAEPCAEWLARASLVPPEDFSDDQHHVLVSWRILEGRHDEARHLAEARNSVQARNDLAWLRLLSGDAPAAAAAAGPLRWIADVEGLVLGSKALAVLPVPKWDAESRNGTPKAV